MMKEESWMGVTEFRKEQENKPAERENEKTPPRLPFLFDLECRTLQKWESFSAFSLKNIREFL